MPHVVIKMYPGRTEEQKKAMAREITRAMIETINAKDETLSIDIEEVQPEDWVEKVYKPEILPKIDKLYKKPGYDPLSK